MKTRTIWGILLGTALLLTVVIGAASAVTSRILRLSSPQPRVRTAGATVTSTRRPRRAGSATRISADNLQAVVFRRGHGIQLGHQHLGGFDRCNVCVGRRTGAQLLALGHPPVGQRGSGDHRHFGQRRHWNPGNAGTASRHAFWLTASTSGSGCSISPFSRNPIMSPRS